MLLKKMCSKAILKSGRGRSTNLNINTWEENDVVVKKSICPYAER